MLRYLLLEIRRTARDRRFVFFTVALPVGFYLLWSNIFTKGGDLDSDTGLDAKTYLLVSMAAFGALGASLTTTGARLAAERQSGWLRQLQVTPLRPWAVITAKVLASMCLALPAIVMVGLVAVLTKHVHLSAGEWAAVSILPRTMRAIAHWTPSNRFADLGWSIAAGHTPPASDALILAGWTVVLGGLATVAYRRATVRS
jgi:ABC-2 type transport system permease protein